MGRAIGGGTVDEVEAIRIRQRGASRVCHYPEKITDKTRWQRLAQYVVSDVENKADRVNAR